MRRAIPWLLALCAGLATATHVTTAPLDTDLRALAALPGEPSIVSAAGITRGENPLLTIENQSAFDPASTKLRLVIVGGLDGDEKGARAAIEAVRWLKNGAPKRLRDRWIVSALPMADPDGRSRAKAFTFPPVKGFYDDPEQPESRYVWRWVTYQAPDLVVEIRAEAANHDAPESLTWALSDVDAAGLGRTKTAILPASASHDDLALTLARVNDRSPMHDAIAKRIARAPLDIARLLAERYPAAPSISYIPSLAWIKTLELSALTKSESLRAKVMAQVQPWLSGEKPLLGDRIQLTTVAGTMVFAEIARADPANAAARRLALEGADAALKEKAGGIPQYGQGWTDDMFMASAILARTSSMPERAGDLDRAAQLLIAYANRLQQPDGIFNHATDGPAAWGRGNGFAAFGLMEVLTAMDAPRLGPTSAGLAKARSAAAEHPSRAAVLAIFQKQMKGLAAWQAPDGMWREIIDRPGAYREETATAMILTAMARGVRLGWLDRAFVPIVDRAWRALSAHVTEDGGLVDVCSGTGAGPTPRYYFDRPAIEGADDRGGAMALVAAMERLR
jgi:rhamnogalacturonyl hydrolase YesR